MRDELHRENPPMEGSTPRAQDATPLGGHSLKCGPQHGLREGASGLGPAPRDTRPDGATRFVETTLGTLSYTELAPLLGERVTHLEEAIQAEEFDSHPLDEYLIRGFHQRICGDLTPDWAGKWRDVEVTVGPLTPPVPHLLPVMMRDYALDLQARWIGASTEDIDLTLEFLAFAEGRFLTIHPFRDFNGRTIRVVLTELLRRLDFPLVNLAPEEDHARALYLSALEAADCLDWRPLIEVWQARLSAES